ncbi:tripartite tricarboxylate transporter TctB family protein [Blastococcus saxobsidens]|uniref:DUF1468 domain-containing protein n=1 Tax=Blastococcus saxobsidens (strain DD2) TaxID=1146883 RepID=H6RNU3_BLASD|nr:tripartite tricarboxylate transporter TctB family protein [Blastococcus saxobsidens]CCG01405.1 conserved membrane protein of unknown function [Blastococcus saxobsidens DD2]
MSKHLHRLAPALLLVFGLAAMYGAYQLGLGELQAPGSGLWPFIVASLMALTALLLLFIDDPDDYEQWNRNALRIAGGLLSLAAFIVLFETIGFVIPAFLMLLLWLRLFAKEPWRWAVPLAVGGALVFYLLFDVALAVPFPDGILFAGTGR